MPNWPQLEQDYQAGTLSPRLRTAYERAKAAGQVPTSAPPPVTAPRVPSASAPPSASPPSPPEDESFLHQAGRVALTYGPPVAAAILTRGRSLARQAVTTGAAAGAGQLAGRTMLSAPGTPEAEGDYRPALNEAARTALETGAAMAAGNLLTPAAPTAGLVRRAGRNMLRAGAGGAGAAVGSLAAEVIDPSHDPGSRALTTGATTAAFDAGFQLGARALGKLVGKSRNLTPEGARAAETLAKEHRPIPADVSQSTIARTADDVASEALVAGTRLRQQHRASEDVLSTRIREFLDDAKAPRDPALQQTMEAQGWRAGLSGEARRLNQRETTQRMYQAVEDMNKAALHQRGQPLPISREARDAAFDVLGQVPTGTPEHRALQHVATAGMLPPALAERLHQTLQQWRDTSGLQGAMLERLDDALAALRKNIDDPVYINMGPLRQTLREVRLDAQGLISPAADRLIAQAMQAPYRMSFGDARTLRSELMELARSYEPGGQQRTPTAMGQAPPPGTGSRFASRLQRQAKKLAGAVDEAIFTDMQALDPAVAQSWRQANEAYQVGIRARDLERWFSQPSILDPQAGGYRGAAILRELARRESRGDLRAMEEAYGPAFVRNMREYANALQVLQERRTASSWRIGHQLMNYGSRLTGAVLMGTGHVMPGAVMLLAPESLAVIFQQPKLTKLLIMGLKAPEGSTEGWRALGQVAGAIQGHGVELPREAAPRTPREPVPPPVPNVQPQGRQAPPPPETAPVAPPAPKPVSPRQEKAYTFYKAKLADPALTQAELNAFWKHQFGTGTDKAARDGFLRAYKERFKQELGAP